MKKRLLSILLTLTMVLSLFPGMTITASAETEGTPEETGTTVNLDFSDSGIPDLVVGGELSGSIVDKDINTTTEGFSASILYWCKKPTSGGDWVQCNTGDIVKSGYNYGFVVAIVADEGGSLESITGVTTNKGTVDQDSVDVQDGGIYATINVEALSGYQPTVSIFGGSVPESVTQGNSVSTPYYVSPSLSYGGSYVGFEWSKDLNREGAWDRQMESLRITGSGNQYYVWNDNTPAGTYYFRVIVQGVHGVDGYVRSEPQTYVITAPNIKIKTESSIYIKAGEEIPKPLGVEADGQTALLENQYVVEFRPNGGSDTDWSANWSELEAVVNGYSKGQSSQFDFRVTVVPDSGTSYTGSATQTVTIGIKAVPQFDLCGGSGTSETPGTPPANPTHPKGYTFGGWYTKGDGRGERVDNGFEDGMTYYARWVKDGMTVCTSTLDFRNMGSETSAGFTWDAGSRILTLNGLYMDIGSTIVMRTVYMTHSNQYYEGRLDVAVTLPEGAIVKFSGTNIINATYSVGSQYTVGNNCNIYCAGDVTFEALTSDAKIVVRNTGTASKYAIGLYSKGNMTVNGGTLDIESANVKNLTNENEVTGNSMGIWCLGNLNVPAGTINATGGLAAYSAGIETEFLTVTGGTVNGYSAEISCGPEKTIYAYGVNVTGCHDYYYESNDRDGYLNVTGGSVNGYAKKIESTTTLPNSGPGSHSMAVGISVEEKGVLNVSGGTVYGESAGAHNQQNNKPASSYSIGVRTGRLDLSGGRVTGKGSADGNAAYYHNENYGVLIGYPEAKSVDTYQNPTTGSSAGESVITGGELFGLNGIRGKGIYFFAPSDAALNTLVAGPGYIEAGIFELNGKMVLQEKAEVKLGGSTTPIEDSVLENPYYGGIPTIISFGPTMSVSGASTNNYVYSLGTNPVTFEAVANSWTDIDSNVKNVENAKAELYRVTNEDEEKICDGTVAFAFGEYTATVTGVDLKGLSVGNYVLYVTVDNPRYTGAEGETISQYIVSSFSFAITAKPMSGAVVAEGDYVYNGGAHTPGVTVKDGEYPLNSVLGVTDYTLSYSNNTNAGTATVTVTYTGNYTGTETLNFAIAKKIVTVSKNDFESVADQTWTGSAITIPTLKMKDGTTLTAGTEYDASYTDNVGPGQATMTFELVDTANIAFQVAEGEEEELELTFWIKKAITSEMITLSQNSFVYDGTAKAPATVTVKDGGNDVEVTFTVDQNNNVNVGDVDVIVTAVPGDDKLYTGEVTVQFAITPKPLTVQWSNTTLAYTAGKEQTPTATLVGVVEGDDVSVGTISGGGIDVGTYTATLTTDGLTGDDAGNYSVNASTEFNICELKFYLSNGTTIANGTNVLGRYLDEALTYGKNFTWQKMPVLAGGLTAKLGDEDPVVGTENFTLIWDKQSSQSERPKAGDQSFTVVFNGKIGEATFSNVPVTTGTVEVLPGYVEIIWSDLIRAYTGEAQDPHAVLKAQGTDVVRVGSYFITDSNGQVVDEVKAVGTYTVTVDTLTGDDAGNYTLIGNSNRTEQLTIEKLNGTIDGEALSDDSDNALVGNMDLEYGCSWSDMPTLADGIVAQLGGEISTDGDYTLVWVNAENSTRPAAGQQNYEIHFTGTVYGIEFDDAVIFEGSVQVDKKDAWFGVSDGYASVREDVLAPQLGMWGVLEADYTLIAGVQGLVTYVGNTNAPGTICITWDTAVGDKALITSALGNNYNIEYKETATIIVTYDTCIIDYNANGGNGEMDSQDWAYDTGYRLLENRFTAPYLMRFKGWEIDSIPYAPGSVYTVKADTTIIAVWENIVVTGDIVDTELNYSNGVYTLPENSASAPAGQRFGGWKVNGIIQNPGVAVDVNNDLHIIRYWESPVHTLTFEANNGTAEFFKTEKLYNGDSYILPECEFEPLAGKEFQCWIIDGEYVYPSEAVVVNSDLTVKAYWADIVYEEFVVRGNVVDMGGHAVPYATVEVWYGNELKDSTTTDVNGNFILTVTEANVYYNFVVTTGDATTTVLKNIGRDGNAGTIRIDLGNLDVNVDVKPGTPATAVGGLDEEAQKIKAELEESLGDTVSVEVEMIVEAKEAPEEPGVQEQIEDRALSQSNNLTYLDIDITKLVKVSVGNTIVSESGNITETEELLEIVVEFDTSNKHNFAVYRYHEGHPSGNDVQMLVESRDTTKERIEVGNGTITMYVKYFSTYAIGYTNGNPPADEPETPVIPSVPVGPGTSGASSYNVKVISQNNGGTVTTSGTYVARGVTVTITVTPDNGYELATLSVQDSFGTEIGLTALGGGKYSFAMPGSNVFVQATFRAVEKTCTKGTSCPIWPYTDASTTAWYHDGVHYCIENGLMNGMTTTQFAPGGTTTRAQIVTILWRLEGQPYASYAMNFADVAAGQWYTEAVRWAAHNGIVDGYSDTVFAPNDAITREQMAAILWRYCQYKGIDVSVGKETNILSYTDAFSVHSWAMDAMQWACGAGVIGGMSDGNGMKLDPTGNANRAQAATMLWRFCTEIVEP